MVETLASLKGMTSSSDSTNLSASYGKDTVRSQEPTFSSKKFNDLSNSPLRKKYFSDEFIPENSLAILSIRVSTKKQERGGSFDEQYETTVAYCKQESLAVERTWQVSESASKHDLRKHFHEMLDYIRQSQNTDRPIKHVVFSFQSRSNRNRKSARDLEDLVESGVTLHFARDRRKLTCKSDVSEYMIWHMENLRNAAYVDDVIKNAVGGAMKSIERGLCPTGTPPYGYKSVGRKDERHFVKDGEKADYMATAFEIIDSPVYIEEKLSDRVLKNKLDAMFPSLPETPDTKRFCELLRNPFYSGVEFIYAKTVFKANPVLQPAIVTRERWLRVQRILEGRHKGRKLSKAHAFIGLMNCSGKLLDEQGNVTEEKCGCAITAEQIRKNYKNGTKQEFNYYRCSNTTKKCSQRDANQMKAVGRANVSYSQGEIETIFQEIFKSFSFDELTCQRMKQFLWDEHFQMKLTNNEKLSLLQKRQIELKAFMDAAYEDKLRGGISEERWRNQSYQWEKEHAGIVEEIHSLKDTTDEYMQRGVQLIELIKHAEMIYQNASSEKKRRLVELVSSNLLLANGTLEYQWKKPFDMLAINGDLENWCARKESNL